jgi:hypothetical protein
MTLDYLNDINYDYINKYRNRTLENSDIEDYNCGGAALLTYNAFIPYRDRTAHIDGVEQLYYCGMTIDEIESIILQKDIAQMLKEFNGDLVLVDKDYTLKQNERLIAYRIFITIDDYDDGIEIDSDFHFKFKDYGQKKWFEKTGFVGKIRSCNLNDWTSGIWEYDSEVVYFKLLIGERI